MCTVGKGVSVSAPFKTMGFYLWQVLDLTHFLLKRLRTQPKSFSKTLSKCILTIFATMVYLKCKVWWHLLAAYQPPIIYQIMSEHLRTFKVLLALIQCFTVLSYAISTFVHLIMLVVLCFDYTSKSITMIHTSSSSVSLIVIICLEGVRGPDHCAYSSVMLPQYVLKLSIAVCLSVYTTLCPIPKS